MEELVTINYKTEEPTISARELHAHLELQKRFSVWFESIKQDFTEGEDFTTVPSGTLVNNGAYRELQDYLLSVEMAKHVCMMSRTDKGKKCRQYLIDLEKAWNSPEQIMARALQVANQTIEGLKNRQQELLEKAATLNRENDLLTQKSLEWADRPLINALVRNYGKAFRGDYAAAWHDFKKELLYRHGINLNARKTAHLNAGGKKSKGTLDFLNDDEIPQALSTAVALCRGNGVDISDAIQRNLEQGGKEA